MSLTDVRKLFVSVSVSKSVQVAVISGKLLERVRVKVLVVVPVTVAPVTTPSEEPPPETVVQVGALPLPLLVKTCPAVPALPFN